jgi:hypothetical protein
MPDEVISSLLEKDHLLTIQKPFQPSLFVKTVRDTIDRRALSSTESSERSV